MREPALGLKTSLLNGGSFLQRIGGNLKSVWKLPWVALPAASAPIFLLDARRARSAPAQAGSTLLHIVLCGAVLWSVANPPIKTTKGSQGTEPYTLPPVPRWLVTATTGSLGNRGESGGHDALPPTAGQLPPESHFALVQPHLADSRPHQLTVAVTISNPDAPEIVRTTNDVGLPWAAEPNGSEGRGENGIGGGKEHGMGMGPGDGVGVAKDGGPYVPVASQVICLICPDPLYSDEARKTKMQGSVWLSVLVGADGRAKDIRILRGIGMGLDENAIAAVRNWKFLPARDASRRPVASWIKIETTFRLF